MKRISRLKIQMILAMMLIISGYASAKNAMHIVINDHLGTPQMLVDENRHVVWKAEYDEFGKANILVEKVEFNLRFPGQYYDKETGLHYNYYRDYDPALGRYVQSDPIGIIKNFNDPQMQVAMQHGVPLQGATSVYAELNHTYGYVIGNPVGLYDLFGLFSYNKPPPATVPVPDGLESKVTCLEQCMGMNNMIITGGAETSGHNAGSKHYTGQAVDVGFGSNPGILSKKDKFFCCAGKCGFEYGQIEGNHFHIQEVSGRNGGRGNVSPKGECDECK